MKSKIMLAVAACAALLATAAQGQTSVIVRKPDNSGPLVGQQTKAASLPVVLPSDANQATSTPVGVTITTALTFQSVLASNTARKGCLVQNTSSDLEYVFFGANASATVAKSIVLQPGQAASCNAPGIVLTDNVSMTSATTNSATAVVVSQ